MALIQVSAPDEHGFCSRGVGVDTTLTAAKCADTVVAEVNEQMARVLGDSFLHVSDIDYMGRTNRPLLELPRQPMTELHRAIGRNIAALMFLSFPGPAFSHGVTHSGVTFCSRSELPRDVATIAHKTRARLWTSELYDPRVQRRIFCHRFRMAPRWRLPWWKKEGYAEYITSRRVTDSEAPPAYQEAGRAGKKLLEGCHFTFDRVISSDLPAPAAILAARGCE